MPFLELLFKKNQSQIEHDTNKLKSQSYIISQEVLERTVQEIGSMKQQQVALEQSLREQHTLASAANEELFLELLEVSDAIEALLEYLANNPHPSPEYIQRLPRSLGAVHRKLLSVLAKRHVCSIELTGTQPDFNLCRVVDREVRSDVPDQTITKEVRRGFCLGDKVLRPTEVITAKAE
jgi:molecular chaperone GrpE